MSSNSSTERGGSRRLRCAAALLTGIAAALFANQGVAATRIHLLAIGNNAPFTTGSEAAAQAPLRYADDDAAAFTELVGETAESTELLTAMDGDTQRLYPRLASIARVPTIDRVRAAIHRISARIAARQTAGDRNVVYFFFSGHGTVDYHGSPALALADGGLDHEFLYRELIAELSADELHLVIDACHAEAVVRPRDAEAEVVSVSPAQADAFLVQNTLQRFPSAGAILASSTTTSAHEWDAIRHGIFTHELLSGLRGAADVNHDGRVEYSEVYAFMTAANREVGDTRARLAIVARPPDANRRAALLVLSEFPRSRSAWLSHVPGQLGIVAIDDASGRRLATLHGDADSRADLLLPAGTTLFVRAGQREASFSPSPGAVIPFETLRFSEVSVRERGSLEASLRRGLFAAEYGRRYYEGVVDQTPGFLPVDFVETTPSARSSSAESARNLRALVLGGGFSTGVADVVTSTHGVNIGLRPLKSNGPALSLSALLDEEGSLTEWHVKASAGWVWTLGHGAVRGHAGALIGAGLLDQNVEGQGGHQSGFADLAPLLGLTANVAGRFGLWSEVELAGRFYREDDRTVLAFVPSAWLGASFGL